MFKFEITKKDKKTKARTGIFKTPHGNLETPNLAFVATNGHIIGIPPETLSQLPIDYIITNTFHVWVKKILFSKVDLRGLTYGLGTIHKHMNFNKTVVSDSGGFQVFSMGFGKAHQVGKIGGMFPGKEHKDLDKNNPVIISEEGVEFEYNNKKMMLTPEKSIQIQNEIGADIIFAFDECTSPLNSYEYTKDAMERTHRWVMRCIKTLQINRKDQRIRSQKPDSSDKPEKSDISDVSDLSCIRFSDSPISSDLSGNKQALFAIVQGGYFEDLRKQSAEYMGKLDVPGFGIGGSLGKTKEDMLRVLEWTIPYLPDEKPRHLLGIGQVRDIFESVERGVDLFDCVIPTREARHRVLYTKKGKINIRKMRNSDDVIDNNCRCLMCSNNITMKQLNNLFTVKDPKAFLYSTAHNIQFFSDLMKNIRHAITNNKFNELKNKYLHYY